MNWADWTILAVIALSGLLGLARGFIREAMALAVWFVAIAVAFLFSDALAVQLKEQIATPSVRQMLAFAVLFVLTMIVGSMVSRLLGQLVKAVGLRGVDRSLGLGFGVIRGVIILLVVLVLLPSIITVEQDPWWIESSLIPYVLSLEDGARSLAAAIWAWLNG